MVQNTERSFRVIWADKAALIVILFFLSLLALCWSLAFLTIGRLGTNHLWNYMGVRGIELAVLPPVLILVLARIVVFLSGGLTLALQFSRSPSPHSEWTRT